MENQKPVMLVIDDNKINRKLISIIFSNEYEVLEAEDGKVGIEMLEKHYSTIKIVILDIIMPKLDGYGVITFMKGNAKYFDIPIIVVSSMDDVETEVKTIDMGVDDIIIRPFDERIIRQRVKSEVQKREINKIVVENALLKQESISQIQMKAVFENIDAGILLCEYSGKGTINIIYANQRFYDFTEITDNKIVKPSSLFPDEDINNIIKEYNYAIKKNQRIDIEYRVKSKNNEILWIKNMGLRINYPDSNRPVLLLFFYDITDIKNTKQQAADTSIQLSTIVNNIPGGIALFEVLENRALCQYFNNNLAKMCGFTVNEYRELLIGNIMNIFFEDDHDLISDIYLNIEKSAPLTPIQATCRLKTKGNNFIWVRFNAVKTSRKEKSLLIYVIFIDISREKAAEAVSERKTKEMEYRANHDILTGIFNYPAFSTATYTMLHSNSETKYSMLRINIASFKMINEVLGQKRGDQILCSLADYIRIYATEVKATYGRLESDHFAICLRTDLINDEMLRAFVNGFLNKNGMNRNVHIVIGIYNIDDIDLTVIQMCDRAYLALQEIKDNYSRIYSIYDDKSREKLITEQQITSNMHDALKNNEFVIYLQPVYRLSDYHMISAEALVRWRFKDGSLMSPASFIPIFEKNGFISDMDYYVWETVCKYLKSRKDRDLEELPISVNISRASLYNDHLAEDIISLAQKYEIKPSILKLEITESSYNDNQVLLLDTIRKLRGYGFSIMMDDFGSGYSSLNALKDIDIDILKIDMKFIENIIESKKASSILVSIIKLAKNIRLPVIAEGVETFCQSEFLKRIGCDSVQGYFFSRPVSIADFEKLPSVLDESDAVCDQQDMPKIFPTFEIENHILDNDIADKIAKFVDESIAFVEITDGKKIRIIKANDNFCFEFAYNSENLSNNCDFDDFISKLELDDLLVKCITVSLTNEPILTEMPLKDRDGIIKKYVIKIGFLTSIDNRSYMIFTIKK